MRLRSKFYSSYTIVAIIMMAVSTALYMTTKDLEESRDIHASGTEIQSRLAVMKQLAYEYSPFNAARSNQQWGGIVDRLTVQAQFLNDRSPVNRSGVKELIARLEGAGDVFEQLQHLYRNDRLSEQRRKIVLGKLISILNSATARADEIVVDARSREEAAADRAVYIILCILAVILLSGAGIFRSMVVQILPSVDRIMKIAARIGSGDLKSEVKPNKDDEFGDIEKSLEAMRSSLERYHQQLDDSRKEAEAANDAKSQFLANMSHELRTPLNAVIGFSDILTIQDPKIYNPGKIRDYASNISQAGRHLLELINDLLDFAKMEAGKLELSQEPFSISDEIANVSSAFAVLLQENMAELEVVEDGSDPFVNGDPVRFRQVLYNLVSNAAKFGAGGKIRIETSSVQLENKRVQLKVTVQDFGIGIPEDRQNAIFNPFSQSDSSITRRFGGTGLGLPISRTLALLMGGDVTVESQPGVGSVFTATFVFDDISSERAGILAAGSTSSGLPVELGLSVLAVDDVSSNRDVIKSMLTELGCRPITFEKASDAIEWIRENDVDAILMDIHMPDVDGITAALAIQNLGSEKSSIPIFAWTADITSREILKEAGIDWAGTLIKPVTRDALLLALRRVGHPGRQPE